MGWVYLRYIPGAEDVRQVQQAEKKVVSSAPPVMYRNPDHWRCVLSAGVDAMITDHPLDCRVAEVANTVEENDGRLMRHFNGGSVSSIDSKCGIAQRTGERGFCATRTTGTSANTRNMHGHTEEICFFDINYERFLHIPYKIHKMYAFLRLFCIFCRNSTGANNKNHTIFHTLGGSCSADSGRLPCRS